MFDPDADRRQCVSNTLSPHTDPVRVGLNVRPLEHSDGPNNPDNPHFPITQDLVAACESSEGNDSALQPVNHTRVTPSADEADADELSEAQLLRLMA